MTIVTWGAMVERCEHAAADSAVDVELLDLRTLMPWDRAAVLASKCKTALPDRARRQSDRRVRRRDCGDPRARCILRPGCADRARHDARRTEPAQSAVARCGGAERRAHHAGNSHHRQRLRTKNEHDGQHRNPRAQRADRGTRSQVQRWLKSVGDAVVENEPLIESRPTRSRSRFRRRPAACSRNPQAGAGRDRARRIARPHRGGRGIAGECRGHCR